jgi:hypothetical protein
MDMATRQKALKSAAAVTVGFGLLTAAAAVPALQGPIVLLADLVIWPLDGAQAGGDRVARLMFAICGGVLAAWGVFLWMLADQVMPEMPEVARRIVLTAALTWFGVDSGASVLAGAPLNVIANLPFLMMYLVPLRGAWPQGAPAARG